MYKVGDIVIATQSWVEDNFGDEDEDGVKYEEEDQPTNLVHRGVVVQNNYQGNPNFYLVQMLTPQWEKFRWGSSHEKNKWYKARYWHFYEDSLLPEILPDIKDCL